MIENVPMVLGIQIATIIAIVLGIAAVVVYFKGARPEKPWGAPLLTLLVIGAVGAVLFERCDVGQQWARERLRFQSARLAGEGLEGEISDGARILIFRYPMAEETMPEESMPPPPEGEDIPEMPTVEEQVAEMTKNWKEAIERGAGVDVEIVACEVPDLPQDMMMMGPEYAGDAQAFNNVLEDYKNEDIDAWVSFVGIPRTMDGNWALRDIVSHDWAKPPMVIAELGVYYDPAQVRDWIESGLLHAAIIHPSTKTPEMVVITANNLDALPDEPPVELAPPPQPPQ